LVKSIFLKRKRKNRKILLKVLRGRNAAKGLKIREKYGLKISRRKEEKEPGRSLPNRAPKRKNHNLKKRLTRKKYKSKLKTPWPA